jgi:hypothetical protein
MRSRKTGTQASSGYVTTWENAAILETNCDLQYSEETATTYARHLLANTTAENTICVLSAPTAFVALKNVLVGYDLSYSEAPQEEN